MIKHKSYLKIKSLGIFKNIKDFKSLEKRIEKISKKKSNLKGDIFEIFVQGLILNDANFNARIAYPSLKQTPPQIRKKLKVGTIDKGIDGVFINNSDEIIPYQAKFRSFEEPAEYGDTLKIEHQGKYASQRYYFYNSKSITKEFFDEEKKNIAVGPYELNKLDSNFFKRFEKWLISYKPPKKKRTKIDGYQQITIDRVRDEFKVSDRATIAMACGSGKSLISFWIAEKLHFKSIVVFVPSKALLKQIREEWLRERYLHGVIEHISVFSEREASDYDAQEINQSELIFKIVNKKEDINNFLSRNTKNTKIVFCTYQSSPLLSSSMPKNFSFDYGVFDEAHKTTSNKIIKRGSKQKFSWNMPLQERFIKINKRLFMTATLRKSNFKKINKLGYEQINYSMKNEAQYGKIVDEFTFVKARKEGVICPIRVIISIVTNDELNFKEISNTAVNIENESVKTEQVAHQIAIKNAVKKYKSKKIFTYHSRCEDAFSFTKNAPEGIKTHLKDFECSYVDGSMKLQDRDDIMDLFKISEKGLVSNARCLIEGVNIPSVDMVSFVSPKKSAVDIVQAAGRAMRIRGLTGKKYGYILLPIFVERFRGEKISNAINRTEFDTVLKFLNALSEYDESIKEEISRKVIKSFRDKGTKQKSKKRDREREENQIEIIGKSFDIEDIKNAIDLKVINFFGVKFEENYAKLLDFKKRYRHTNVKLLQSNINYPYRELAEWVNKLRLTYRAKNLDSFRISQLNKINFRWSFDGETLSNIKGLINESDIRKIYKIKNISRYREGNLIIPDGYYKNISVSPYYSHQNIKKFLKDCGVTLTSTKNLFTISGIADKYQITSQSVSKLYLNRILKPVGFYFNNTANKHFQIKQNIKVPISPYFKLPNKNQILSLFNADYFMLKKIPDNFIAEVNLSKKKGMTAIPKLRRQNKIKSFRAITRTGVIIVYLKKDIKKAQETIFGVSQDIDTSNLISETRLSKILNNVMISSYRKKGKIKPVLYKKISEAGGSLQAFYNLDVIDKYYKLRGVTLRDTKGLIVESDVAKKFGVSHSTIMRLRKKGKIKPVGTAINKSILAHYYSKDIFKILNLIYPNYIKKLTNEMVTIKSNIVIKNRLINKIRLKFYKKELKPIGITKYDSSFTNVYKKKDILKLI